MEVPLKTVHRTTYDPAIHSWAELSLKRQMHLHVHCTLFTIAKTWKQAKCPPTADWIRKMWYIYTHNGILLSHKKNQIMPFVATWMEPETLIHYVK